MRSGGTWTLVVILNENFLPENEISDSIFENESLKFNLKVLEILWRSFLFQISDRTEWPEQNRLKTGLETGF